MLDGTRFAEGDFLTRTGELYTAALALVFVGRVRSCWSWRNEGEDLYPFTFLRHGRMDLSGTGGMHTAAPALVSGRNLRFVASWVRLCPGGGG